MEIGTSSHLLEAFSGKGTRPNSLTVMKSRLFLQRRLSLE
jgi:hypothetical protein